jgi:hypothetical protein
MGFIVFFRNQLFSKFDLMFGDRGDGRFIVFMHEHVFQWIIGKSALLSPPFFFNQANTLGYSEALLLDQFIYTPSRLLGLDPFLATNLVAPILSVVGFTAVFSLLRCFGTSSIIASVAAILSVFSNNLFLKGVHPQHFVVYFLPVVAVCAFFALTNLYRSPHRALAVAGVGGLLFGMTFSTSFYIAWFFTLDLIFFIPVVLYLSWPIPFQWWKLNPKRVVGLLIITTSGVLAGLSVFAVIYAPVIIIAGRRNFADYLIYAPNIFDIVNVGNQNFLWGPLITASGLINDERLTSTEATVALTPILQVMTLISLAFALNRHFWSDAKQIVRAVVIAAAAVPFLFFLITVKVGDFSLFKFLYAIVPGAGVIRAGFRGMVVANLFAVLSVSLCFNHLLRAASRRRSYAILGACGLALCVVEQLNLAQTANLSRAAEYNHLARVERPPRACSSFYVLDEVGYQSYEVQLDAMLVALEEGIPTENGYSGVFPPGWDFYDTKAAVYEDRVLNWVSEKRLAEGLCRLDIIRGSWANALNDSGFACLLNKCPPIVSFVSANKFVIDFRLGGNSALFTDRRWFAAESWGQWTSDREARISFTLRERKAVNFDVSLRGLLSVLAQRQTVSISANGCLVASAILETKQSSAMQTVSGTIPEICVKPDGSVALVIDTDRILRPSDIGLNADQRRLGIGVESVVLHD